MAAMCAELPEVRLLPDRDWGSKPLPLADVSSTISASDACADDSSAAESFGFNHDSSAEGAGASACSLPNPADNGAWNRLLNGCCGSTAAAAGLWQRDSEAIAASCRPAAGSLPCCGGSSTVMSGSMSETGSAHDAASPAPADAACSGDAAASWPADSPPIQPQQPPQFALRVSSGGHMREVHCNQVSGLTVRLCWRCPG